MLTLYDGLNVIRRRLENDPMGRAPRSIVTEMLNTTPGSAHVWCFEGSQHLSRRRDLYPEYKNRPSNMMDGFFDLVRLIQKAMENTNAIQVAVPTYEADDVIAHLTCKFAGQTPIEIRTTDRDLNQLLVLPGVKSLAKPKDGVEPQYVKLYKTYVGDTSDRIPGLRGFGDESWTAADKKRMTVAHQRLMAGDPNEGLFVEAGFPARLARKAIQDAELLRTFDTIVGFFEPTNVDQYLKSGTPNPDKADAILREFNH